MVSFFSVVLAHKNICCHIKSPGCLVDLRFGRTVSGVKGRLCLPSVMALPDLILQGVSVRMAVCFPFFSVSLFCLVMFSRYPLSIFRYPLLSFFGIKFVSCYPASVEQDTSIEPHWGTFITAPSPWLNQNSIVYSAVSFVHNLYS